MQEKKANNLHQKLNFSAPEATVKLQKEQLDITNLFFNVNKNSKNHYFFNPADPNTPASTRKFILCRSNLIRAYSISGVDGIKLHCQFSIPEFSTNFHSQIVRNMERTFINRTNSNKITIFTKKEIKDWGNEIDYLELDLNNGSVNRGIYPLQIYHDGHEQDKHFLLANADSPRVYIRNCLLELNHLEVSQTYLNPNMKVKKPNILSKFNNKNISNCLISETNKLTEKQISLYGSLIGAYYWGISKRLSHKNLARSSQHTITREDINSRLFFINFTLLKFYQVIKVYDKLSRRVLKVITLIPGKILADVLQAKKMLNKKTQVKNARVTHLDLLEDRLTIEGEIYMKNKRKKIDGFFEFKLQAQNYLLKKTDEMFQLDIITKELAVKKDVFGKFYYFLEERENVVEISYHRKTGPKVESKTVNLDKDKDPLLDRMKEILELGVMEKANLIYFRDQRFLYLADTNTGKIKQRLRYSSFDRLVEFEKEKMVSQGFFCKLDEKTLLLELFQIKGNTVIDLKDIDLKSVLTTRTFTKKGVQVRSLLDIRIGESKNNEVSILSTVSIGWKGQGWYDRANYWLVFYLDKKSLEITSSMSVLKERIQGFDSSDLSDFRYNSRKEYWHSLGLSKDSCYHFKIVKGFGYPKHKKITILGAKKFLKNRYYRKIHYFFNQRIYVEGGWNGDYSSKKIILLVFGRSNDPSQPKGSYSRRRKLVVQKESYRFIDEDSSQLKVFCFKEGGDGQSPEIVIADRDLVVTHKLTVDQGCCGLLPSQTHITTLPFLAGSSKLVLAVENISYIEKSFKSPKMIFLLDLNDLGLTKFIKEGKTQTRGTGSSDGVLSYGHSFTDFQLWGLDFLVLDSYMIGRRSIGISTISN